MFIVLGTPSSLEGVELNYEFTSRVLEILCGADRRTLTPVVSSWLYSLLAPTTNLRSGCQQETPKQLIGFVPISANFYWSSWASLDWGIYLARARTRRG